MGREGTGLQMKNNEGYHAQQQGRRSVGLTSRKDGLGVAGCDTLSPTGSGSCRGSR